MVPDKDGGASAGIPARPGKGSARKVFTLAYKLRILELAEELKARGGLGEFLRREGLYSSHLSQWKKKHAEGRLVEGGRGRPRKDAAPLLKENHALRRELEKLNRILAEADFLLRLQREIYAPPASAAGEGPGGGYDREGVLEKVDRARGEIALLRICEVLAIPRRDYYRWLKRGRSSRSAQSDRNDRSP